MIKIFEKLKKNYLKNLEIEENILNILNFDYFLLIN